MLKIQPIVTGTAVSIRGALGLLRATTAASAAPAASSATAAQPAATTLPAQGTLPGGSAFAGVLSNRTTAVVTGVEQLSGTIGGARLPSGGTDLTAPVQGPAVAEGCSKPTNSAGGS